MALVVRDLGYTPSGAEAPALDGVDFELPSGLSLALAGRSGSGKSTLLSILAGLAPRFLKGSLRGGAELDGESPGSFTVAEWGAKAGYLSQNPETQFLAATAEEDVLLTLRCRGLSAPEARKAADERLEALGLEEARSRPVHQLSEGQKQKAVLASLTALRPKLLLLDEPGANLDPGSLSALRKSLLAIKAEGVGLVVADHHLGWLRGVCERALVLEGGRMA
jgi:energy-coupling factor transport system ATP-binding protein